MKNVGSQGRSFENLNATNITAIEHQFNWLRADRSAKYGRISLSTGTMILEAESTAVMLLEQSNS